MCTSLPMIADLCPSDFGELVTPDCRITVELCLRLRLSQYGVRIEVL